MSKMTEPSLDDQFKIIYLFGLNYWEVKRLVDDYELKQRQGKDPKGVNK